MLVFLLIVVVKVGGTNTFEIDTSIFKDKSVCYKQVELHTAEIKKEGKTGVVQCVKRIVQ